MLKSVQNIKESLLGFFQQTDELRSIELSEEFVTTTNTVNLRRIKFFSLLLFTIMLLLIVRDYYVSRNEGLWQINIVYYELFICHIVLCLFSLTFYFISRTSLLYRKLQRNASVYGIAIAFALGICLWSAFLSGWVTQKVHDHITEYIMAVFGVASTLFFRPALSGIILIISEVFFIVILSLSLPSPNETGHVTNSLVIILLAWAISRFSYVSRLRLFANLKTISNQKKEIESANASLQKQNKYLDELNSEKNEFLGIVAHDLKNPLAAILLASDTIIRFGDTMPKEQTDKILHQVKVTSLRMKTIVNNLLDINSIESGAMKVNIKEFNPVNVINNVVEDFAPAAKKKGITVHCYHNVTEASIVSDEVLFQEIVDNIISNAIKYTPLNGTVHISTRLNTSDDTEFFECSVKDSGPGLTDEDKIKLFGKFQRLSAQPTGDEHSTGLGLAIVKRLLDTLGGKIVCESMLGNGATFTIIIPIKK